ncbi:hypothetical protein Tco_0465059 [Tanacetum coccineum]
MVEMLSHMILTGETVTCKSLRREQSQVISQEQSASALYSASVDDLETTVLVLCDFLSGGGEGGGGMFGGDVESGGEVLIVVMLLVGVMYSGVVGGEDVAVEGGDDGVVLVEVELMGSCEVEGLEGVFGAGYNMLVGVG